MAWLKTRHPGVRYREHNTRKYRGNPDRMYSIRYRNKITGKDQEEVCGWSSRGMNTQRATTIRNELINNIKDGIHPQSLTEKLEMQKEQFIQDKKWQEKEAKANITFGEIAERYFDWLKQNSKNPNSELSRHRTHLKPRFAEIPAKDIHPLMIEKFKRELQQKGLAPKTIHHYLTLITTIYKKAIQWKLYQGKIPTADVDLPKVNNKRLRYLSYVEASLLLAELKKLSQNAWAEAMLALYCGLRSGDIKNLKWKDINFQESIITTPDPKTGESQHCFMTDEIKVMLLVLLPANPGLNDWVFLGRKGGQSTGDKTTFSKVVKALGFNNGLAPNDRKNRVVFHTLRHTFCSWLAIQGVPLYTIQQLARHKDITQTQRYSHLCPDHKRDAVKEMAQVFKDTQKKKADLFKFAEIKK